MAIADPVRSDVPRAIAACQRAGVEIKIVTGDNAATASDVARQVGLEIGVTTTGTEFAEMNDSDASEAAENLTVLARARPADKLRLVKLLQAKGHVVAVTGDGVNDGPALNHANVGLSMGQSGTAVAREASDIVLLNDSFSSIVTAVMWGRSLYENIQRFLVFQLTINVAALGLAVFGPVFGVRLPLTVMQMLWVNLIMDTFAALALATGGANPYVLRRPPRKPDDFIITPGMAWGIIVSGILFIAAIFGLIHWLSSSGIPIDDGDPSRGGTIMFTAFVLLQFWNVFNARAIGTGKWVFAGLLENPWFLMVATVIPVGQFLIVQFGGSAFRTQPLSASDWLWLFAGTVPVLVCGEIVRFVRLRHLRQQPIAESN
ncbi:MAG: cation-translocating P-type ATPase [Gemmataceae bacterium]